MSSTEKSNTVQKISLRRIAPGFYKWSDSTLGISCRIDRNYHGGRNWRVLWSHDHSETNHRTLPQVRESILEKHRSVTAEKNPPAPDYDSELAAVTDYAETALMGTQRRDHLVLDIDTLSHVCGAVYGPFNANGPEWAVSLYQKPQDGDLGQRIGYAGMLPDRESARVVMAAFALRRLGKITTETKHQIIKEAQAGKFSSIANKTRRVAAAALENLQHSSEQSDRAGHIGCHLSEWSLVIAEATLKELNTESVVYSLWYDGPQRPESWVGVTATRR